MIKFIKKLIKKKSEKGFTLIELIVVIAILGILAAILVPTVTNVISTANTNTDQANAKTAYMAAQVMVTNITAGSTAPSKYTDEVKSQLGLTSDTSVTLFVKVSSTAAGYTVDGVTYQKGTNTKQTYPTGASAITASTAN